ncbi:uncharacterized protein LOC129800784 [Phlebotomus papatasi]|uniref:uncharacterized protein LOC129800784 n=1 Tax=Phlebotomus papatasi TaxID=29031 RepID=UPI00248466FC|nr:uncharacterized protein LOC129800784 [Phlebotomus papatasi]
MTERPFCAVLPQQLKFNDEIVLKGKIKDNASVFSVNFCLESSPTPSYIAYHFKTLFRVDREVGVIHNHKNNSWGEEIVESNTWIDGPGEEFILTFLFTNRDITVYTDDDNRCFQYKYDHQLDIGDIRTVQIWDDLEYIREVIFRYKHPSENSI